MSDDGSAHGVTVGAVGGAAQPAHVSIGKALVVALVLTILAFGAKILMFAVFGGDDENAPIGQQPMQWVALVVYSIIASAVIVGAVRLARVSLGDIGWRFAPARDLPWALVAFAGAALFPVTVVVADGGGGFGALVDGVTAGPFGQRAMFAMIGLVAAFTEESAFRGMLQPALTRRFGTVVGIVIGAAVFSVYHVPRHPLQLAGRFVTGLVLGFVAHRTGALWAGAVGHFLIWLVLGAL